MKYQVVATGQGAGYSKGDIIQIPKEHSGSIKDIAWYVNSKANLNVIDLGFIGGDELEMFFGTKMDGIQFQTPVLQIKKIC